MRSDVERCRWSSRCESGPRNRRFVSVATWTACEATCASKLQGQRPSSAGSASVRAAMRVKLEQAPKVLIRMSSRPHNGEDHCRPAWTAEATGRIRRGIERSTYASTSTQHVRSVEAHGEVQRCCRCRPKQKSEEPIVVTKPGNAGGAKGLWFGVRPKKTDGRGLA
jgi:hypothetical protein